MLETYFHSLSLVMAAEARLLGKVYRAHRGKLGENREALLHRYFSTYLPQRFGVGSGFALLGPEAVSTQQDIVIYDRLNNPVLFPDSTAPLFPPSALAAVVEVKSRLRRDELESAVKKVQALKQGVRASFQHHPRPPQHGPLACMFAFTARSLPLPALLDALADLEEALGVERVDRLDMICVLGRGVVYGGSVFYAMSTDGQPLTPASPSISQQRLALETPHELLAFYSKLLDHIMAQGEVRPQLMSYLPPDTEIGKIVAVG